MEADDKTARQERAHARRGWPGVKLHLDELPEFELVTGTPAELMGMVTELTLAAWAMRGTPLPSYSRKQMPGRVIRTTSDGR